MPPNEIQGFCLVDNLPYSIVINSANYITGKIFTIFHELGHLIKKQSGICYPDKIINTQIIEFECNSFAGNVLIPSEAVYPVLSADGIYKQANKLKVSSEAYLRRQKSLGLINDNVFFELLKEIRGKVIKIPKPFGRATQVQKSISSRGQHLFNSVSEAANNNKISYTLASDVLGIKLNHLLNY